MINFVGGAVADATVGATLFPPAGTLPGDLLVVNTGQNYNAAIYTGWTSFASIAGTTWGGWYVGYYRFADGTSADNWLSSGYYVEYRCMAAYRGVKQQTPLGAYNGNINYQQIPSRTAPAGGLTEILVYTTASAAITKTPRVGTPWNGGQRYVGAGNCWIYDHTVPSGTVGGQLLESAYDASFNTYGTMAAVLMVEPNPRTKTRMIL